MVLFSAEKTPDDAFIGNSIKTINKYAMKLYERISKTGFPFLEWLEGLFSIFSFENIQNYLFFQIK